MGWLVTLILNFVWNKVFGLISDWLKGLAARWKKDKAIDDATKKAIEDHNQRDLEREIGNSHAGEVSGEEGAVVQQDPPPNVGA